MLLTFKLTNSFIIMQMDLNGDKVLCCFQIINAVFCSHTYLDTLHSEDQVVVLLMLNVYIWES